MDFGKEASSFSEEKEAKRLYPMASPWWREGAQGEAIGQKFFGSFFQKRTFFLPWL